MTRDWLWDGDEITSASPSTRKGIATGMEMRIRREGVHVIKTVGMHLKLYPLVYFKKFEMESRTMNPTLATAAVYFHRFYMFHAVKDFVRQYTALACLFLAGKVEETPKKCRDICLAALDTCPKLFPPKQDALEKLIEEVMGHERVLLHTLKFDLHVELPYKYQSFFVAHMQTMVRYVKQYVRSFQMGRDEASQILQTAWAFVNDSQSTTLAIQWEPQIVAVALVYLALKMQKKDRGLWWDEFVANLSTDQIDEICHKVLKVLGFPLENEQILDFYTLMKNEVIDFSTREGAGDTGTTP